MLMWETNVVIELSFIKLDHIKYLLSLFKLLSLF